MNPRAAICFCLIALGAGALAGCGESKEDKAEATVRDFAKQFNARSPKLCEDVYSEGFIKISTGKTGKAGLAACQRELKKFGGTDALSITIRSIRSAEQKNGKILVSATIDVDGKLRTAFFQVDPESYRIDAIG